MIKNDHTQTESEMYRRQMLAVTEENDLLRQNVRELQGQLQNAYMRIMELIDNDDASNSRNEQPQYKTSEDRS